ncbi:MAG: CocE/NonD family hydrolase, partial [Ginsengibacter sp.]
QLSTRKPKVKNLFAEYVSDPANPVPYTAKTSGRRNNEYMVEDQRFASERKDVLTYESAVLSEDITIGGKITADIFVSLSTTDADFIVKLIDVVPGNEIDIPQTDQIHDGKGFQRLVRAEVMRGKFRNNYVKPEAFVPGKVSEVKFYLNDVLHTFKKGHKIMVQVQSSWFPLVDMNPQTFMRIPEADAKDFQKSTIRVYQDGVNASRIILPVIKN